MKEGGTSLHKTFRGINLAFKGLSGRGPGTFSNMSDVTGRKAVERL